MRRLLLALTPLLLGVGTWGDRDIAPYLTNPTHTGITVHWESVRATTSRVEYGLTPDRLDEVVADDALTNSHEVRLRGLEPNQRYYYRAMAHDGDGNLVFATQPVAFETARTGSAPFRFVFMGETHSGSEFRSASQASFVAAVNTFAPHLLLNAGDHVNSGGQLDEWVRFFLEAGPMIDHIPLMNAWGNHDTANLQNPAGEPALQLFDHPGNERYYSFDYGNTLFIALDVMWNYDGRSEVALRWLVELLVDASDGVDDPAFIVVYLHPPVYGANLYAGTCAGSGQDVDWVRTTVQPLFALFDVSLVLSGHEMIYAHAIADDVHYLQLTSSDRLRSIQCPSPEIVAMTMSPAIARVSVDCQEMHVEGYVLEGLVNGTSWLATTGERTFEQFTIPARPNTDCLDRPPVSDEQADAGVGEPDAQVGFGASGGGGCRTGGGTSLGFALLLLGLLSRARAQSGDSRYACPRAGRSGGRQSAARPSRDGTARNPIAAPGR